MQRNFLIKVFLVFLLMASSFIVLWSSSSTKTATKTSAETMEECSKTNKKNSSGEMILETLSRQFFSSSEVCN